MEEVTNLKEFEMKEETIFMKEDSLPSSELDNTHIFSGQEGGVKEEDVNKEDAKENGKFCNFKYLI